MFVAERNVLDHQIEDADTKMIEPRSPNEHPV